MKWGVLICSLLPGILAGQIKFSAAPELINFSEHFSGSVLGISDMNGDGLDDIIRLAYSKDLSIEYQSAPGQPFIHRYIGAVSPFEQWSLTIGDINQDGFNDMVFAANENPANVYYSQKTSDSISYQIEILQTSDEAYAQASNLVDINNDGWLDYFMCNDLGENKIWANHGGKLSGLPSKWIDFTTVPASDKSGNYGSVWSDLDRDGDLDLYVAKCKGGVSDPKDPRRVNALYLNNGNGGYIENAANAGLDIGLQSWVAITGDSDNDGDQDIFILNHFANCQLMVNNGNGQFVDVTGSSGINYTAVGVQAAWVDFDNDGLLDLLISGNQHQLYRNKGNNQFELQPGQILGLQQIESFAVGDLNNDGKPDLYVSYGLLFNAASHRPDGVWLNTSSNNNHYFKLRLTGTTSNKSAIGTSATLHSGGYKLTKEIHSGISYGTSHSLMLHFGLGNLSKIDSIVIRWPNRQKETIYAPFIDRTLNIVQNLCFAFDPVLNPGIKPAICNSADSIVLTAPINGAYLWSNGLTSKSIAIKSPGNYQLRLITLEGCTVFSNKIHIEDDTRSVYKVQASDTIICDGSSSQLTVSSGKQMVWNTGDTTSTITVFNPGQYFASISDYCSQINSDTAFIRVITPAVSNIKNDTIPRSSPATLMASGQSLSWFANAAGGPVLSAGNTFTTMPLEKTTTYYVQSILTTPGNKFNAGINSFSGVSKYHAATFSGRLLFDVQSACILKSVKVYADTPGLRQIDLLSNTGQLLSSKLVLIQAGESRVDLNFPLNPGFGYALVSNDSVAVKLFGNRSPRLYRTEGAIGYPLKSGAVTIYGTNAGQGNYYYYYDWELVYPDLVCMSERVPVSAVILSVPLNQETSHPFIFYPNPVKQTLHLEWFTQVPQGEVLIELFNMQGSIINTQRQFVSGQSLKLNLPPLNTGIYLIKAKTKQSEKVFRITVMK